MTTDNSPTTKTYIGVLKFFNERKRYGFIVSEDFKEDVFFHFSSVNKGKIEILIEKDTILKFNVCNSEKGFHAKNIFIIENGMIILKNFYKNFYSILGGIVNEEVIKTKKIMY